MVDDGVSPYQRVPESDEDDEEGCYDEDGLLQGLIRTHDLLPQLQGEGKCVCVCVWKTRIRDPTDPYRVTCYFLQTNKQRRFVKLRFPVPGKPTVCMPIYT